MWRVPAASGEPTPANGGATAQLVLVIDHDRLWTNHDRLWLIGTGPTPAFGAALACDIERTTGRRVTDVIVTRAAPELSMGNVAFANARLWALPDVIDAMRERCGQCMARSKARLGEAGESLSDEAIRVPGRPIGAAHRAEGRIGPFDWLAVERAPGEQVLVLKLKASAVVVAQGLLWAGDVPDLRDTRSDAMLASLRALQAFAGGARVLGEQGGVAGLGGIAGHIAYIEALRSAVRGHLARGDVQGAAGSEVDLPAFATLPGYALRHPLNVQRVWRELEPDVFR
ncbi:hypothetical protein BH11PSE9_BH11PSE9_27380 [soil metagenome]